MTEHDGSGPGPCSEGARMPLYLMAIGGMLKIFVQYHLELYEARKVASRVLDERRRQDEDIQEFTTPYHLSIGSEANREVITNDERIKGMCDGFKEGVSKFAHFFFVVSISAQLVLDILTVHSSDTSAGWERYQCYAETFFNSPNLSSVVVFLILAVMRKLMLLPGYISGTSLGHGTTFRVCFAILLYLVYTPIFLTHSCMIMIIYPWIPVLYGVGCLFLVCCVVVVSRMFCSRTYIHPMHEVLLDDARRDPADHQDVSHDDVRREPAADGVPNSDDEFFRELNSYNYSMLRHFVQILQEENEGDTLGCWSALVWGSVIIGGLCVAVPPYATSVMVRWYSNPDDYIGSAGDALTERHTMAFLQRETETLQEKAANWYSYIHYFV